MKHKIAILFKSLTCDHVYKDVSPSKDTDRVKWQCVTCGKTFDSYRPLNTVNNEVVGCNCKPFTEKDITSLSSARSEITYALESKKTEDVKAHYLNNAKLSITEVLNRIDSHEGNTNQSYITESQMRELYTHGFDDDEVVDMSEIVDTDGVYEYRICDELSGVNLLLVVHVNNKLILAVSPVSHNVKHKLITQDSSIERYKDGVKVKFTNQKKQQEVILRLVEVIDE